MSCFAGTALTCRRGDRLVFTDLDFALEAGGALLLVGPNGSGKSSLLRLMAGLIKPFAGRLDWDGVPTTADPALHRGRVSYLGHLDAVKPVQSGRESVAFWADLWGRSGQGDSALAALGLSDLADLPARFLSAGQRRRVALARVIATAAPLWLLDEPTVGLDRASIAALEAALAAHRAAGGMLVAATHAPILLPGSVHLDLARFSVRVEAA